MARIRTIKPEFWQDEKIAELPFQARLLFIGIWTLADDGGVLRGSEKFIKSQLFPYDDALRANEVRKWIDALVNARMLIPLEYKGESYLYIRTFRSHQKINRPSEARHIDEEMLIKMLDNTDSSDAHGVLSEYSPQEKEREGKGNKEKEGDTRGREVKVKIEFPFDSENFREEWENWKKYKSVEHRFTYKTEKSESAALKQLKDLSSGDESTAIAIIKKSISNGWKGLFALKREDYANIKTNLKPAGVEPRREIDSYGNL
ncbi:MULTISPECIES: hypothetical protein [unclassified Sphingobacterium]|uniref:hypothetical protein n=1 Tax=unclassified Sphingobacterium TaxID=2609468 RepID=UPI0025FFBBEF|nr:MULTISPECIES: hypothetical protein [unclassified Sphingobacterium]